LIERSACRINSAEDTPEQIRNVRHSWIPRLADAQTPVESTADIVQTPQES
jgi:hypothetical protein